MTFAALRSGMALLAILLAAPAGGALAEQAFSKDVGPSSASCDKAGPGSAAWRACVGAATAGMPDSELFYAGYWLAKNGQYAEALGYLELAKVKDERVLTYIGFARRKLGDVDGALPYYSEALKRNPDFVVARAYLGEAYLTKDEPERARGELAEIERRCGSSCPPYADLARQIAAYDGAHGDRHIE